LPQPTKPRDGGAAGAAAAPPAAPPPAAPPAAPPARPALAAPGGSSGRGNAPPLA